MLKYCALYSLCVSVSLAANFVTGQGARLVIGQSTFTAQEAGATDSILGGVGGLAYFGGKLFITGTNRLGLTPLNHRVLIMDVSGFPKPLDEIPAFSGRCPVCVGQASVVLGQPDFTSVDYNLTRDGLRLPTAVATDGTVLAVADTSNNRVLLWNTIPTTNGAPADVVLGQSSFDSVKAVAVDAKSLRAPQGVWIQDGRLFVADTQNHRVLIWNSIPTQNEQPADVVVGQANLNVAVEPDLTLATVEARADTLLNPVSVTSDGVRLYVSDLGHNRVLIWNSIPTTNGKAADVVIGQKDFTGSLANDVQNLCDPLLDANGDPKTDATTGDTLYPARCGRTLDFPRYALSDGTRLFLADGGNDRVLVYNQIPTQSAPAPDAVLGQVDEFASGVTSYTDLFHPLLRQSAADIIPTPTSLAFDGTNLYVTDPSNRRVLVFTAGEPLIPINGVRNSASREIFALGSVAVRLSTITNADGTLGQGMITAGDTATVTINDVDHTYTVQANDTVTSIMENIATTINSGTGDPVVFAEYEPLLGVVKLQAKVAGTAGNDITIAIATNDGAGIEAAASGATLQGGQNATVIAPGTLVSMLGQGLADTTAAADLSQNPLPRDLGGVQAYFDGIRSPLLFVSDGQVNAQVPFEVLGSNNISFYLRIQKSDGSVIATTAIAVPIDNQNPGIFAMEGEEPRQVVAYHATSNATGTITVDGSVNEGDVGTITIAGRTFAYTVKADDTLDSVRDAFVQLINSDTEVPVVAVPVGSFHRIRLRAKIAGPAGEGVKYTGDSAAGANSTSVFLILSSTSGELCCANVRDAPVTTLNPAIPGESIYVYATGLGQVYPQQAADHAVTGEQYDGPTVNDPNEFVSSLAGGSTANVISAGLLPGTVGLYKVVLELSPGMSVFASYAQLTISQFIYTSNVVNLPVRNPAQSNVGQ